MASAALFRLLGDDTRLRLLRVLAAEPLNVSELTAVLGLAQSGVSRHLGLLKDAGLVREDRRGTVSVHQLEPAVCRDPGWTWLRESFAQPTASTRADDARLEEVRRVRKENFDRHRDTGERRQLVPGRSWAAWSRALGLLMPPLDVADLGCGEGYLTVETARWARRVIAVDRSAEVLAHGQALALRRRARNITWKRGELDALPLKDASVDLALLSQALHHAADPARALVEAHRILRPGGRVLILDLSEHHEAWVRTTLGDRWLGFTPAALQSLLAGAGFRDITVRTGARNTGDPFAVLIASGVR